MKFKIDHDYHIHSHLSLCSADAEQNAARILEYAKENGLSRVCVTDHYWDEGVTGASDWYKPQNFAHISQIKPLPKCAGVDFLFGCETDMDKFFTVGIPKERFPDFDFIIVPTTHLHMTGFTVDSGCDGAERRAELWIRRLDALLSAPLPFHKVGIAHLACPLIDKKSRADYLGALNALREDDMAKLFTKAARLGAGIELNQTDMSFNDGEADTVLRPFRIAKACGCRFYLGSDAHHPKEFESTRLVFSRAIDLLDLKESDKFHIGE